MLEVEIWSDIACPFCLIGKKNFEKALQNFESKDQVRVNWRSFELDPGAEKSQKVKIEEILARKYGRSVEWARQMNQNLAEKGKAAGIDFHFEKLIPTNTFDAHRLLHWAREQGKQNEMKELLLQAYFVEGLDVADFSVLENTAVQAGLKAEDARAFLQSAKFAGEVRADEEQARQFGISGVPAFVFKREFLVSGAQPPEAFLEALREAFKAGD